LYENTKNLEAKAILRKKNGIGGIACLTSGSTKSHSHQDSMVLTQRQKYRSMVPHSGFDLHFSDNE